MFSLSIEYKKHSGACRNDKDQYNDIGDVSEQVHSLSECKKKCDETPGCGAFSWSAQTACIMTSSMAKTTDETQYTCYVKGSLKLVNIKSLKNCNIFSGGP